MTNVTEADRIPEDFLIGKTYTIGGHSQYSTWVLKKMVWPFAYLETPKSGKKMETHQANLRLTPADAMEVAKLRIGEVDEFMREIKPVADSINVSEEVLRGFAKSVGEAVQKARVSRSVLEKIISQVDTSGMSLEQAQKKIATTIIKKFN